MPITIDVKANVDQAVQNLQRLDNEVENVGKESMNLADITTGLNQAFELGQKALGYLRDAYDATIKPAMDYARQVRDLALFTGMGYEETSRLIQSTEDMGVEFTSLNAALKAMVRQGLTPSIDSLAELSDKYLTLQPGIERSEFLLKNFGRSGGDMAKAMSLGSKAIREMSTAVDDNEIVTDKNIESTERLRIAMIGLNDAISAVSRTIGFSLTDVLAREANNLAALVNLLNGKGIEIQLDWWPSEDDFPPPDLDATKKEFDETAETAEEASSRIKQTFDDLNTAIGGSVGKLKEKAAEEMRPVIEEINSVRTAITNLQIEIDTGMYEGIQPTAEQMQGMDALNARLGELEEKAAGLEQKAKDAMKALAFEMLSDRIKDSKLPVDEQLTLVSDLAENMGMIDEETQKMVQGVNDAVSNMELGNMQAANTILQTIMAMPDEKFITIHIATDGEIPNVPTLGGGAPMTVNTGTAPTLDQVISNGAMQTYWGGGQDPYDNGGAVGLDMTVPPGYPADSYRIGATSGERVIVQTPGQVENRSGATLYNPTFNVFGVAGLSEVMEGLSQI